ncbi:MAG: hypothetical protein P1U70_17110, partial [Saprospiraceae bacterium]|nr:hypothetical protein [Saprospiraceae bacterium]
MKFKFIFTLFSFTLIWSCTKDSENREIVTITNSNKTEITDLEVPDGFNYNTVRSVNFDLTLVDSLGKEAENVVTTISGVTDGE